MCMKIGDYIYLDNAAATPMCDSAIEAMRPFYDEKFFNPSAPYGPAREVKKCINQAREEIAHIMGAKPDNIIFTAGATEANNLAFANVSETGKIAVSAIEHASVLSIASAKGAQIIEVKNDGLVTKDALKDAITPETELVSIAYANGEIGTVQPIRELANVVAQERERRLKANESRPILFHSDCSQAAAHLSVNVSSLKADLITVSAAKLGGPKQMGLLFAAPGIKLKPLIFGGGQEKGLRSGTENVAGIMGFAAAFKECSETYKEIAHAHQAMRNKAQHFMQRSLPYAIYAGPAKNACKLPNLLHVSFPKLQASRLVILLEKRGVLVGTGAACAANKMQDSPTLSAIGFTHEQMQGSLRISYGQKTSTEDATYATGIIIDTVDQEYMRIGM